MNHNCITNSNKEEVKIINLDNDKLVYVQFGNNFLELQSFSIYQDGSCTRANLEFVKNKNLKLN